MAVRLLLAATGDGGTGVPYLGTVATPIGVLALFALLYRIQRTSDRDKGKRIEQLHDDITAADRTARELRDAVTAAENRATAAALKAEQNEIEAAACAWRLAIVIRVVEEYGITMPPEVRLPPGPEGNR